MTRQEAIGELKKVDTLDMPVRLCEAHYMSIKALEKESTLDKIRAEIEASKRTDYQRNTKTYDKCIEIIDKYINT